MVASGFVFTFWNAINLRPSLLTDPLYQDQKTGLERNMNISLLVIFGMALGLTAIYGRSGYVPSICMAATGIGMYSWVSAELNHIDVTRSDTVSAASKHSPQDSVGNIPRFPILYAPNNLYSTSSPPVKRRRERAI
jgi:hypothetical protein